MKSLWIAIGIMGMIPLVAAAQYPATKSVIKPVGFGFAKSGCGCSEPAPTCCTPVPPPSIGNCCPRPCLLENIRRGLRSLDCLLPCGLGCHSINCHSSCGGGGCSSCSASCATKSSCGSCCTKSRAHFFAFCKPKCGCSSCGVGCSTPCEMGCCQGVPSGTMYPPMPPPAEDNPFKDDIRPMDRNAPPAGQSTYKPYFKKNNVPSHSGYQPQPTPARLDPYAVAPPVHIKARPAQAPVSKPAPVADKYASRLAETVTPEYASVRTAVNQEVETVSLTIADDEPPAPPMVLPAAARPIVTAKRIDSSIPVNPLR